MFAKLLKYDLKANVKLFCLLGGCALGVGCLSAIVLRLLTSNWEKIAANDGLMLVMIPAIFFLFFSYLGIILYGASTQYILLYRFYKSRFTDEGYLMFTLPVKTHHIFLSGALNNLIWSLITAVVILLSLLIAVVLGPVWPAEVLEEIHWVFEDMSSIFAGSMPAGFSIGTVFYVLVLGFYSIIAPMSAVVLGATAAKKHKVLAIIGILIALSACMSTANGIISGAVQLIAFTTNDATKLVTIAPLLNSIVPLGMAIGGYFLSIHIMKNKLNLP